MAVKQSVVVWCRGFRCRLRQCMNRLLLKRRNIPMTRMDCGRRTRHWSSRWDTSRRWCRPLSMPQAARLCASHWAALSSSGGRLVTSATVSGACWRDAGEVQRLGAAGAGAQDAPFGLALVKLPVAGQRGRGRARGKNPPAGRALVFRGSPAGWAGCPCRSAASQRRVRTPAPARSGPGCGGQRG